MRAVRHKQTAFKSASTIITALATSTILSAISSEAYATAPVTCANPLNGSVTTACTVPDQKFTIGTRGVITPAMTATAVAVSSDYSAGSTLTNNGTITIGSLASASLTGINVNGNVNGTIVNNGTIHLDQETPNNTSVFGINASDVNGTIINNHIIDVTDNGTGVASSSYAYGIDVENVTGALQNNGSVSATANNDSNFDSARAIQIGGSLTGTLTNNGTLTATATNGNGQARVWGIFAASMGNTGVIANNGTITATSNATGHTNTAYGIVINSDMDGTITNSGTIIASATAGNVRAKAYGIFVNGDVNGNITNNGAIAASVSVGTEDAHAYGMYIGSDLNGVLTNNGTISATSNVSTNAAYAEGIHLSNGIGANGAIVNNGVISVTSSAPYEPTLSGIVVSGTVNGTIVNNGTIAVNANDPMHYGYSATGIYAGALHGSMINNGNIDITASGNFGAYAYAVSAGSVDVDGLIANHGTINATIHSTSSGSAFGIHVNGGMDGTVTNTGIITATFDHNPANAYSIYVVSGGAGTVNNSGILTGGIVTSGTIDVTNSGIIAFVANQHGANSGSLANDYTQTAGGKIILGVAGDGTYSNFSVTHNANFTGSSQLGVVLSADNNYSGATLTNVITAGNSLIHPNAFTVTDNSLAYNFTTNISGNDVSLAATSTGLTTLAAATQATGNVSGAGAAGALDSLLTSGTTEQINALSTIFGGATTNQQASNAVSQFVPLLSGGINQVALDTGHITSRIVQSRVDSQSGISSGENFTLSDRNFWLKPFGSWADQSDRNGASGYNASTGGIVLGGDALAKDNLRLGVAFAYAHSNVDSNNNAAPQSDRIDNYQGIFYGSYNMNPVTAVNFQADIGDNTNEGKRSVASTLAFSDYDSWAEHVGASVERKFMLGDTTAFIPSLRADYTNIHSNGYSETGAGFFNLNVDSNSAQEFIIGIDGKMSHPLNQYLALSGNLGVGYDTLAQRDSIGASFIGGGAAFATKGIDPSPWIGNAGIGLTLNKWQGIEVTARYDLEARSDFTQQTASLKLRLPF